MKTRAEPTAAAGSAAATEGEIQREYFARNAARWNAGHHHAGANENLFALGILSGALDYLDAESVLDVGAGSGVSMKHLSARRPAMRVSGIEPVKELRDLAYGQGIARDALKEGDALALPFENGSWDVVYALSVLHHVRRPERAVAEMLRVARKAVFISDGNNFGQGGIVVRSVKQLLNAAGLWKLADWAKTRGKGYTITEGDGLAYSYSVFNDYKLLRSQCRVVHLVNTDRAGFNLYRSSPHLAVLGIK